MTNTITNKDYITITENGVTVGGKPTTTYRGEDIWCVRSLPKIFKDIQQTVKEEYGAAPIEMRVMSSETGGEYAKPGNPSPKHGKNAWGQFVFANGIETRWVFTHSHSSASACAAHCASNCGYRVRDYSDFRSGVFGSVADAIKQQSWQKTTDNNMKINLDKKIGDIIEMNFGNSIMQLKIIGIKEKGK